MSKYLETVLRAPSGTLSAAETSTASDQLEAYNVGSVVLKVTTITTADVDDEVDFYLQTRLTAGDWMDIANVHFDNSDNGSTATRIINLDHPHALIDGGIALTDGTIADNTSADIRFLSELRWKTAVTGATAPSYAYESSALLRD